MRWKPPSGVSVSMSFCRLNGSLEESSSEGNLKATIIKKLFRVHDKTPIGRSTLGEQLGKCPGPETVIRSVRIYLIIQRYVEDPR